MISPDKKWRPRKSTYTEGLQYMAGRMSGKIKSLRTPWEKFNAAGTLGIEWQSTVILAGRPGSLKSAIKDNIIQESFDLNKDQKFRVLDFRFEMLGKVTALREFSSAIARPYKDLCNAGDTPLTKEEYMRCYEYAKTKANSEEYPVDIIDEPCTVQDFTNIIMEYMEEFKTTSGYTPTIIAVDHSLLFEKAPYESSDHEMLAHFGKALTKLKKRYPIIFLVLSQLNRAIEEPSRSEDGKASNYIKTSDIYGSDALLMHADLVIGLNRPALSGIKFYGSLRFVVSGPEMLAVHWLKVRNGETLISFFECDFNSMTIREADPPASAIRKLPTMTPIQEKKIEEKPLNSLEPNTLFTHQNPNF